MIKFNWIKEVDAWLDTTGPGSPYAGLAAHLQENRELLELLTILEETNPCAQAYYAAEKAFLVTYQRPLNLLTFWRKALTVNAMILGLPISLSRSGILALEEASGRQLALAVMEQHKGLSVALNTDYCLAGQGLTLSNFIFSNRFSSFDDYLQSMRASYRRNLNRILDSGSELSFQRIDATDFGEDHYALYRSVVQRSDYPLEILPLAFFRRVDCQLIEVRDQENQLKAVLVLKDSGDTLVFMFCGFARDDASGLYHNLLLYVIRKGIEEGFASIDMGQTSEEAKLRLGCWEQLKHLTLVHSNPLINTLLQPLAERFSYRRYPTSHRVFR